MKKERERLALHKETVRNLSQDEAQRVVGGWVRTQGCTGNLTGTCPGAIIVSQTCSCQSATWCCPFI